MREVRVFNKLISFHSVEISIYSVVNLTYQKQAASYEGTEISRQHISFILFSRTLSISTRYK